MPCQIGMLDGELQLKLGKMETGYFREKLNADILEVFGPTYQRLQDEGVLTFNEKEGIYLWSNWVL